MGRRLWCMSALTLVVSALLWAPTTAGAATRHGTACVARHVIYVEGKIEVHYRPGCTGHDEPELDPVSSLPHSAQNLTWKAVLPTDGAFPVSGTGFGFWFGGTVTDPHSLFGQAFLEVQFYPDTLVSRCDPNGNSQYTFSRNTYTVCTPVWSVVGNNEPAAFNAMLRNGHKRGPLVMHGGDTILLHYYQTPARDGAHVTVTDLTTHQSGTVILNSKRWGPLMPAFSRQVVGNALGWGIVDDAPNSFVWEIGHRSDFSARPGAFCAPGHSGCESYNWRAWFETTPIQIESVTFGDRGTRQALGGGQRLRRQGRDPRPERDRIDVHALRRPVLHLSLVQPEREWIVQLRRQPLDHRGQLRQREPVRAPHPLRRPVRGRTAPTA